MRGKKINVDGIIENDYRYRSLVAVREHPSFAW
jgi:hypothetical protein